MTIVGKTFSRKDGVDKVTGKALYVNDISIPGMWVGGTLRSSEVRGVINKITFSSSFDWTQVVVVQATDLPGPNFVAMVRNDFPILAEKEISYWKQPILLIAAPDNNILQQALTSVVVDITPLHPVLTIEEALQKDTIIHGDTNIIEKYRIQTGDTKKGFEKADFIVEGCYRTGYQEHVYLEPQGMIARPCGENCVEVIGSLQCPYYVHNAICKGLNLTHEKVIVKQAVTGGAFGGKEDYPSVLALHASLLALKAQRPIKIIYDREEDILGTTKRHPSLIYHRTGVKKDGTIVASEVDLSLDGGAFTTLSIVVLQRSILHAMGPYRMDNFALEGRVVATNTPPNGAFRGFGVPQSAFAIERHMDRIAKTLQLSPVEIRRKNIMKDGDTFPFGQKVDSIHASLVLEEALKQSHFFKKEKEYAYYNKINDNGIKKGIGVALAFHGGGFTGSGEEKIAGKVKISYEPNEKIGIYVSSVEMGQGAATVLPMIAAETLELPFEKVIHHQPNTAYTPDSGPTVASRTTMFVGSVVKKTCQMLLRKLEEYLALWHNTSTSSIHYNNGVFSLPDNHKFYFDEIAHRYVQEHGKLEIQGEYTPPPNLLWDEETYRGAAYKDYSWIAYVVETNVNMDTYEIQPTLCTVVAEVGKAIHPVLARGQIEGGALQALGYSYLENLQIEDGRYVSGHLNAYLIPTSMDTPAFNTHIAEVESPTGPYGAKGLGELPMDGGAPALASAVWNATSLFTSQIPITGEMLFELENNLIQKGVEKNDY